MDIEDFSQICHSLTVKLQPATAITAHGVPSVQCFVAAPAEGISLLQPLPDKVNHVCKVSFLGTELASGVAAISVVMYESW